MTTSSRSKTGPRPVRRARGALRHELALAVAAGAVLGFVMQLTPQASPELGMGPMHRAATTPDHAQTPAPAAASSALATDGPSAKCPAKDATRGRH